MCKIAEKGKADLMNNDKNLLVLNNIKFDIAFALHA